ncbi:DUF5794 domain-containing protein [Halopelagius longus]|uniref:Uncharacterized protein n=1 Tax=Halopelagius longus TaxID=1236180 RepID=A0A1H1B9A9_9EURY|nr:DUF5794 domain-containing protein [Halopelagius longus]RDI70694.1 hypothetical protein DWB78_02550 [Halopelagius longus]SDQ48489.1 hypothetical protein SAMN05216278_1695 [Halopelagius longus]
MSVSRHPVALRLEQHVGGATRLLATVMALPLVDGIFPALIIAGALSSPASILETGLLIFGGSATVAVILAEMEGTRREQITSVLLIGAFIIPIAGIEAVFAETLRTLLAFEVFHRFAGLVILAVAAKTASSKVGEYLPSPSIIIGLGLVASFDPSGARLIVDPNVTTILHAAAAAGTGVGFALLVALFAPRLRGAVDIDRFRFGSSVALGMLAIDVLGLLPTDRPIALGVLAVTALFAFDPNAGEADADSAAEESGPSSAALADGGDSDPSPAAADSDDDAADADPDSDAGYGYPGEDESRAPWL